MRDIYGAIAARLHSGISFAAATLVAARGARASVAGTSLVVDTDGSFLGDIGAGCHEATILERAQHLLAGALASQGTVEPQTMRFDLEDEVLAGSGCGASLDVVLWIPQNDFLPTAERVARGDEDVRFGLAGAVIAVKRRRRLVIVGGTALAAQLTALARRADFAVAVVDPRPPFATRARHPDADELLLLWPDDPVAVARMEEADAIAVLSHDVKLDLPALEAALRTPAVYVGLLGNRRVQRARRAALQERGVDDAAIARLRGPAGLDIGAATDGQTALSILAEIVAAQHERSGAPLSSGDGPIHASS